MMIKVISTLTLPILLLAVSACGSSDSSGDSSGDSAGDSSSNSTSSELSLRLLESIATRSNGSVLSIKTEYSDSGNLLKQVFTEDGVVTLTTTFETKPDGQFIRRIGFNQDGVEDRSSDYAYSGALGLSKIYRLNSNSVITHFEIFKGEGALVTSRETRDIEDAATVDLVDETSGVVNFLRQFEYEDGRVIGHTIDANGDGIDVSRSDYSYNQDGTLASTSLTSPTGGTTSSTTYVYEQGPCNRNSGNSIQHYFCIEGN